MKKCLNCTCIIGACDIHYETVDGLITRIYYKCHCGTEEEYKWNEIVM